MGELSNIARAIILRSSDDYNEFDSAFISVVNFVCFFFFFFTFK